MKKEFIMAKQSSESQNKGATVFDSSYTVSQEFTDKIREFHKQKAEERKHLR